MIDGLLALYAGAVGLGLLHGIEPGHGWPVAAAWALARRHPRRSGVLAATVIGLGHLISSLAVVIAFFAVKRWLDLGASHWLAWIAGGLLLALAARQLRAALRAGDHSHHDDSEAPDVRSGLWALALFAFTLGFAHEEEFQLIALCAGSNQCLSLMLSYALAVMAGLVALTLLLIAGMERFRHVLENAHRHLTLLSAAILAGMGIGFLAGVF